MEKADVQPKEVYDQIKKSNSMFHFLQWTKSSDESNGAHKATTFNAKKSSYGA